MQIFGFGDLPGGVVYDDVPPGTMMLVHSAVVCVPGHPLAARSELVTQPQN